MNRKSIQNQLDFTESLTPLEKAVLEFYTTNGYTDINNLCRGKTCNFKLKDINAIVNIMFDMISRSPLTEKDITVYRGIHSKYRKNFYKRYGYEEIGFVSTSRTFNGARTFADKTNKKPICCIVAIRIPKGSSVLAVEDISQLVSEFEIILPIGTRFDYRNEKIVNGYRTICVDADVPEPDLISEKQLVKAFETVTPFIVEEYTRRVKGRVSAGQKIQSDENPILVDIYEKFDVKGFMKDKILKFLSKEGKIWHKYKVNDKLTLIGLLTMLLNKFSIISISPPLMDGTFTIFSGKDENTREMFDFIKSKIDHDKHNIKVSMQSNFIAIGLGGNPVKAC